MSTHYDFMIVGQGLAGCLLAQALGRRGASCVVIGKTLPLAATPVAAGIMNPVTGQRLAMSWKADYFIPQAKTFYRSLGQDWNELLLHEGRILRFPRYEKELIKFRRKRTDPAFAPFLGEEFPPGQWAEKGWRDDEGSYEICGVGWVDVERIATIFREKFRHMGFLRDMVFDHKDLKIKENGVRWQDEEAEIVVFCEGARVVDNPWFQDLPFTPSRGETIDLVSKQEPEGEILQSGSWFHSSPDGTQRAGSTYDHDDLASGPTEAGRMQILNGLNRFLKEPPKVVGQRCGLRPATRDRLPVMGRHPDDPRLALFNGFGSKGVLWTPALADCFAAHLMENGPIDKEIDLLRFTTRTA